MELSEAHKAHIARFITYFRGKRERLLLDQESEKNEFIMDRLADDQAIFNKHDVEALIDGFHAKVAGSVRDTVEEFINLSAVYVSQVLLQAEHAGVALDADLGAIENQNRMDQIALLAQQGMAPSLNKRAGTLPQLGAIQPPTPTSAGSDPAILSRLQELELENHQMRERYNMMQSQVSELLRERTYLTGELEKAGASIAGLSQLPEHLAETTQYRDLQAIVKKKNEEVRQLRQVLLLNGIPLPGAHGGIELPAEDD